ncbi:PREDICTED: uncharacterized protein LOC107329292 [Acropora digitifera]|uniref:uncharacterized protein LOC107329292 n=1 Tax=Acropora digitifera TaxID=70779 RepID=UPI00077B02DB|nr:PREDICTED: uncharacterized protein LOC107329292 [Acropora digitifera]
MTKMQRNISAVSQLHDKFSKVKEENTCLRGQRTPTSKFKEATRNDSICYGGKNIVNKTPNQPVKTSPKNGVPISKVAENVSQKSKIPFKRNALAAKRKLSFDASGLFEDLDGDANLQQITQSIRKHAERKTAFKVS